MMVPSVHHLFQSEQILRALVAASNKEARSSVLSLALISLDHEDETIHDEEIRFGADTMVVQCLRRAVYDDVESRETIRLCRLLQAVYKCSDSMAAASFRTHGAILFPLLVRVASTVPVQLRSKDMAAMLLQRIMPFGISITSVKDSDLLMIALVRFLRNGDAGCQKYALVAIDAITIHPESKSPIVNYPGLLEAIVASGNTAMVEAMTVLKNLAWDSANRDLIVKNVGLLELLERAMSVKQQSVRVNACSCLQRLSLEASIRAEIVSFRSSALVKCLMELLEDPNSDVSSTALDTISNLVCESTAAAIGGMPNLLEGLGEIACTPSSDVSVAAARAIKRLAVYIRTRDKCHQTLCDVLISMSKCKGLGVPHWAAKSYVELSLKVSSSFVLVRSDPAMSGLLRLGLSPFGRVRACAVEAIANLAQEPANARRIATRTGVFDILLHNINVTDEDGGTEVARREAVRAILCMANHRAASKLAAKQNGLIQSLSVYGTSVDGDIELKRAALHGVLVLAPSM